MSGLLRNLASHALGAAPAVHSIARLPFAAPPRFGGGTTSGPGAASPVPTDHRTFVGGEPNVSHFVQPSHPAPSLAASGTPALPEISEGAALSGHPLEPIASNDLRRMREDGRAERFDDRATFEPPDLHLAVLDRIRELAPLVAFHQRSAIAPPIAPSVSATSVNAKRDVTHDVHVTIGRIEVTAMNDRPAVRQSAPRTHQHMSLDEYLARRRGSRP